ncbi:MAG TPA: hypothetical protein VII44_08680, partial [Puia sp.]
LPPGIENIDMPSYKLLIEFAASGGQIIQFSRLKTIDGSQNPLLDAFYKNEFPGLIKADSLDNSIISIYFSNKEFSIQYNEEQNGDLYHYRRKLMDGELLFLSNASLTHSTKGSFTMNGGDLLLADLFSGEIYKYPNHKVHTGSSADFEIPAAGSLLFFIPSVKTNGYKEYKIQSLSGKTIDAPTHTVRKSDNSLTIDFCDLQIGDTLLKDAHVFDAADKVFKYYGFSDGNPWNTSVQFKDNTIKRDTFSKFTGFTATYFFNIQEDIDLSTLKAVVENPHLYKVFMNEHEIFHDPVKWWLDKDFKVFEIGKYVHKGKNSVSIIASPMSVYAEIEPVYILGDFGLSSANNGWNIIKPQSLQLGSWKTQGMPMFGQQISYSKRITISKNATKQWLVQLGKWRGTVATIHVNNKPAGIIAIAPYVLDITGYLHGGQNTIEVNVIGSLKNVLGPFHRNPEPGMVSPWHWRYVKGYPSGNEYDIYDYGLMDDFKIIENEESVKPK